MQFANYNAFRADVQRLVENDDTIGTFSNNTMDLLIGLGEARVYNGDAQSAGLRASTMVKSATLTAVDNAASLPPDLLELKEVMLDGGKKVEVIEVDRLRRQFADGIGGNRSLYVAQDGDSLIFWPQAVGGIDIKYYCRPTDLESVTWVNATTFARYPELFIFATLYESALFLGMEDRVPAWESKYRALADGANHSERMRVYGGSPLRTRPR